jgi:hypothetical protein
LEPALRGRAAPGERGAQSTVRAGTHRAGRAAIAAANGREALPNPHGGSRPAVRLRMRGGTPAGWSPLTPHSPSPGARGALAHSSPPHAHPSMPPILCSPVVAVDGCPAPRGPHLCVRTPGGAGRGRITANSAHGKEAPQPRPQPQPREVCARGARDTRTHVRLGAVAAGEAGSGGARARVRHRSAGARARPAVQTPGPHGRLSRVCAPCTTARPAWHDRSTAKPGICARGHA